MEFMSAYAKEPKYITPVDPNAGKLAHQHLLEQLFNKNQTISRIREEFQECKEFNFTAYMEEKGLNPAFGMDLLIQMVLHKQTTIPVMVGILRHHLGTSKDELQQCADLIEKAIDIGLVIWNNDTRKLVVKFNITDDIQRDLDRFQYPLPMIVEPLDVTHNKEDGYLTTKGSLLLKKSHHDDDICLDHINRCNKIKFVINDDTATMVKNKWRNLDKPKAGEHHGDYQKRLKAFHKYTTVSLEVIRLLVQEGKEFYFTHKYDKRGRTYCQGYHCSYQGNPWNKAVIELANKELVV